MNESVFTREIQDSIKLYGWAEHIIPNAYGMRNTPDILACVKGTPIGLECKMVKELPDRETSKILSYTFTRGQMEIAKKMTSAGYRMVGLINIRPLKIALITQIDSEVIILKSDIMKWKRLGYAGKGMWDLKELWEYLDLLPKKD